MRQSSWREPNSPAGRKNHDSSGYLSADPICALSSGVGGAIAVIRVSGDGSAEILRSLSGWNTLVAGQLRKVTLRWPISDPQNSPSLKRPEELGRKLDEAMAVFFEASKSFTGEDSFELHVHGSPHVVSQILRALRESGARQALPGEFSFRAVRNGKFSLSQAEAAADLIASTNSAAANLALEKLSGSQIKWAESIAGDLRSVAMLGEIGIDFSDQDVEEVSLPALRSKIPSLIAALSRLRDSYSRGSRIQDGLGVVFVGLPNAGKSSFFNALLGEDRSIVSDEAGTTRDVVREKMTLEGSSGSVTLRLEDTAGLRESDNRVEKIGIERSVSAAKKADLILFLADSSNPEFSQIIEQWKRLGTPHDKTLGIITKVDLSTPSQGQELAETLGKKIGISTWLFTSAFSGEGISEAARAIADFSSRWLKREPEEWVLTRQDHFEATLRAIDCLERAQASLEIDLFAADTRQALVALAPVIGETVPDDLLGLIFSKFCIGK